MVVSFPDVPRETHTTLAEYVALLLKWNKAINLIGPSTESDIWNRHIHDGYQLLSYIPQGAKTLLDMGSGAGLPGLVVAVARPALSVTLLERDTRKAAFMQEAIARLALKNAHVSCETIEVHTGAYDVVTARALANLAKLCGYAYPLLGENSPICLFAKGENYATELAEAQREWAFEHHVHPSAIQENSVIISLSQLNKIES